MLPEEQRCNCCRKLRTSETETELGDVIDNRERKILWHLSLNSDLINAHHCVTDALSTVLHTVE